MNGVVTQTCRECIEDTVLGGKRIPAGTKLWLNVLAVHHDPAHYPDPEVPGRPSLQRAKPV